MQYNLYSHVLNHLKYEKPQDREHSQSEFSEDIRGLLHFTKPPSTTMAGTSGCIPDFEVNLFGQLCKPALPPFVVTTSEPEPRDGINSQLDDPLVPQRTATKTAEPDPIALAFQKHQHLIRGFSGANAEVYLATVKEVFAEVRRDRMKGCVEQPQEQQLAKHDPVKQHNENPAERQNKCQVDQQKQPPPQKKDKHRSPHRQKSPRRHRSLPGHIAQTAPSLVIPKDKKDAKRLFPSPPKRRDAMRCIECVLESHEKKCSRRS